MTEEVVDEKIYKIILPSGKECGPGRPAGPAAGGNLQEEDVRQHPQGGVCLKGMVVSKGKIWTCWPFHGESSRLKGMAVY